MGVLVVTPLLFPSLPPSRFVFLPPSFPSLTPYSSFSVLSCKSLGNNITNGAVQYSTERSEEGRHIVDTTITVNCNNGYGPGGIITCESSGNWSDDLPHCDCEFMSTNIHAHALLFLLFKKCKETLPCLASIPDVYLIIDVKLCAFLTSGQQHQGSSSAVIGVSIVSFLLILYCLHVILGLQSHVYSPY